MAHAACLCGSTVDPMNILSAQGPVGAETSVSGLRSGFSRRYLCNPSHRSIKAIRPPHHPILFPLPPDSILRPKKGCFLLYLPFWGGVRRKKGSNSAKSEIRIEYSQKKIGLKILTRLHSPNLHSSPILPSTSSTPHLDSFSLVFLSKEERKEEKRGKTVW